MENLFSYGTLQKSETQLRIFGRLLDGSRDTLVGYKTADIEIGDESFLANEERRQLTARVSDGDKIGGTVFEITTEELVMVDGYEPENYERIRVKLDSGKGAWLYLEQRTTPSAAKQRGCHPSFVRRGAIRKYDRT